jgi:hypothetical protein
MNYPNFHVNSKVKNRVKRFPLPKVVILKPFNNDYFLGDNMLVRNVTHIINNVAIFERYGRSENPTEREFFNEHLRRGMNFVAIKIGDKYVFAPSRFVGYIDNDMNKHEDNPYKDGRDTDIRLKEIMKSQQMSDILIEQAFLNMCSELNIVPDNRERQYWVIELPNLEWFG